MDGELGSNTEEIIGGGWDQGREVRQCIPDLVHNGGHHWHCARADNVSDTHLVHQPGIELGAQRWQQHQFHQQCQHDMMFCTVGFVLLGGDVVFGEGSWRVDRMQGVPPGGVEDVGISPDRSPQWEGETSRTQRLGVDNHVQDKVEIGGRVPTLKR